jgi:hypothetical protein
MNIFSRYDAFTDVHASSANYWCRDKPSYDQQQPCDPDADPSEEGGGGGSSYGGGHGGGSAGGGHGGGSAGGGHGGGWGGDDRRPPDPPDDADLGGDEDTTQW